MLEYLKEIKEELFDAPIEVKEAFNELVNYFDLKSRYPRDNENCVVVLKTKKYANPMVDIIPKIMIESYFNKDKEKSQYEVMHKGTRKDCEEWLINHLEESRKRYNELHNRE